MNLKSLILLLLIPTLLFAERPPVMLKIVAKNFTFSPEVTAVFRMGVEEILTGNYRLIDEAAQEEALKEQSTQQKKSCYDDSCLVDVGKMIAARGIFLVEVIKMGIQYAFKMRYIDIEQATTERTKSMFYKGALTDGEGILNFSKKLSRALLNGSSTTPTKTITGRIYQQKYQLTIQSNPSKAKIYNTANRYIGTTPVTLSLPKGNYKYRFSKYNYHNKTHNIYLNRNHTFTTRLLSKSMVNVTFKVTTSPAADIYINGVLKGKTPLKMSMKKGDYNLELRTGVLTLKKRISIRYSATITYALYESVPMTITSIPVGASVKIGGVYRGITPLTINKIDAKRHKIYLSKSGFYSKTLYFTPSKNINRKNAILNKRRIYRRSSYRRGNNHSGLIFGFSTMEYFNVTDPSDSLEYSGIYDVVGLYFGVGSIEHESRGQSRFYLMGYVPLLRIGVSNSDYLEGAGDSDDELLFLIEPSVRLMYGWTFGDMFHFDLGVKAHYSELIPSDVGGVLRFGVGFSEDHSFWMSFFAVEMFYGIQKNFIINFVLLDFFGLIN